MSPTLVYLCQKFQSNCKKVKLLKIRYFVNEHFTILIIFIMVNFIEDYICEILAGINVVVLLSSPADQRYWLINVIFTFDNTYSVCMHSEQRITFIYQKYLPKPNQNPIFDSFCGQYQIFLNQRFKSKTDLKLIGNQYKIQLTPYIFPIVL